jgi:hypothetical protein
MEGYDGWMGDHKIHGYGSRDGYVCAISLLRQECYYDLGLSSY